MRRIVNQNNWNNERHRKRNLKQNKITRSVLRWEPKALKCQPRN